MCICSETIYRFAKTQNPSINTFQSTSTNKLMITPSLNMLSAVNLTSNAV